MMFCRKKVILAVLETAFLLLSCAAAPPLTVLYKPDGSPERYAGKVQPGKVMIPARYIQPAAEMRGVWIATVENIDFPRHADLAGFQKTIRSMFARLRAHNFNTVFFQVRPCNDAFYKSKFNPWSRYLTGKEGVAPAGTGDPLTIAIREAKNQGLQFYAWLNPYRVIGKTTINKRRYLATLAPGNFARRNPHLVLDAPLPGGKHLLFLNPGEPEVVRHVVQTVQEIAENYPVDGIVFDDYFYPYEGTGNLDARSYVRNNPRRLPREQWRTENVNTLIRTVRQTLQAHNRRTGQKIQFGISPFGIWANRKDHPAGSLTAGKSSLQVQHADTRMWVKQNYVDCIIPQIYWPFRHDTAAYAALADWWAQQVRGTKVKLYIGMAPYRLGEGQWPHASELLNQLRYNTKHPEIKGQVMYNCNSILAPSTPAMKNAIKQLRSIYWRTQVPTASPASTRGGYPRMR